MYFFVTRTSARFPVFGNCDCHWLMLLPEFLTFDDTSDMWRVISVNYISCCCRWWRRHQIRQEIVSNVRDISHITSQILQIYEFAEPDQKTQTKQFWFGSDSSRSRVRFGSVRFEFYIFFCVSVLVRFGSEKMWVLVRFEFGSIPISTFKAVSACWVVGQAQYSRSRGCQFYCY